MTAFLQLVGQIQSPIMTLLGMIPQLIHATASVDRLAEIEKLEQEEETSKGALIQKNVHQEEEEKEGTTSFGIKMEHVFYQYPGSEEVLTDFNYDFRPGSSTAILGATGCGKTSLLRLIAHITSPSAGRVCLYSHSGVEVKGADMRRHIIYIEQGNTMMSGSIRENLLLAKPDATEEEMQKALHTAVANFVYELPEALDTRIGEHATRLSGGQAQRLSIARGLLREGSILLLDEVSSSLDERTESILFDRLFSAYPEKTIICVTHRPEAARHCDAQIKF